MMVSLAFVAPDIIEAAVRGSLPRGIGLTRLMDLPPLWADQRQALGAAAPSVIKITAGKTLRSMTFPRIDLIIALLSVV